MTKLPNDTVLRLAEEVGSVSYTPPPMRAVRGRSFTYEQLTEFAALIQAELEKAEPAIDYEHWKAIKEAKCISASDEYFKARHDSLDTRDRRVVFENGFDRGYRSGETK